MNLIEFTDTINNGGRLLVEPNTLIHDWMSKNCYTDIQSKQTFKMDKNTFKSLKKHVHRVCKQHDIETSDKYNIRIKVI